MIAYMEYNKDAEDTLVLEANGEIIKEICGFSKGVVEYSNLQLTLNPISWAEYVLLKAIYPKARDI